MSNDIFQHQQFWFNTSKSKMTDYEAIGIAEGFIEESDENRVIEAWQHLVDTKLAWSLQGWFGRTAHQMIEEGVLKFPEQHNKN